MKHFHNAAIIAKKQEFLCDMTLTYRLFENYFNETPLYSLLITKTEKDEETDFYIAGISVCKSTAMHIFHTINKNLVLPSETPFLFSDGAFDENFSDNFS